ncbi:MAG: YafY family transcriptional regulator [Pseudomonadales bacterium]|jgi:predicted DNA-binding transcriptional regulator YafY|nr:YafY family transcriptional regulator [Pseudomonadales bacterium]
MRRADRLFQIVQLIGGRRLSTAAFLAGRLEVSERTIYRDVAALQGRGVPIEGEAGVGYRLGAGFRLPPLMFKSEEAAARLAQHWLDPALSTALEDALGKVLSVLPTPARNQAEALPLYAPPVDGLAPLHLRALREAITARLKLRLLYRDVSQQESARIVRPLGCFYWGRVWTLGAWCELRGDFRSFRLDRIADLQLSTEHFRDEPGRTLADFLRQVETDDEHAR